MMGTNAVAGYLLSTIVLPGKRHTKDALEGMEEYSEAPYGQSNNGWMDTKLIFIYLHHIVSYVSECHIPAPVILFADGRSTYMLLKYAEYYSQHAIILYCLLANAAHILQPVSCWAPFSFKILTGERGKSGFREPLISSLDHSFIVNSPEPSSPH